MINRTLLIVDDEPNIIHSLSRQLRRENYNILSAYSGMAALDLLADNDIGVILSDQMMPEMDGVTFLEAAKKKKPDTVRLMLTGQSSIENTMAAVNRSQVFEYLTKPWTADTLRGTIARAFEHYNLVRENKRLHQLTLDQNEQLKRLNENLESLVHDRTLQLEEAVQEGVVMLALAAEAKDDDTGNHINRISSLTGKICRGLGLSSEDADKISFFSVMHDIGKIHVPDRILNNQGPLSPEDWAVMKTHTTEGEKILGLKPYYQIAREIARSHHERWDGTGYPDGLEGREIPLPARIVSVADVYDALTHRRSYKPAIPKEKSIAMMRKFSGSSFDPDILEVFLDIFDSGDGDDK